MDETKETVPVTSPEELEAMRQETARALLDAGYAGDKDAARARWNDLVIACYHGDSFEAVYRLLREV